MITMDPTDLHALADATEAERQRDELRAKRAIDDLKWLMAHKQGRRLAYGWLGDAGVFRNPFNHSGSVTAFNCGQMNLGQQFLSRVMEHTPDAFVRMLEEQKTNDD